MLDDLKMIHNRDSRDALGVAEKLPLQLLHDVDIESVAKAITDRHGIVNVVYWSYDELSASAEIVKRLPNLSVPLEVITTRGLPAYIGGRTLLIVAGYALDSGMEATALEQAARSGAAVVVLASEGVLADEAKTRNLPTVHLPAGLTERQLPLSGLVALIAVLEAAGVLSGQSPQWLGVSKWLQSEAAAWLPTIPTINNEAKAIALELAGKSVLLGAGPLMAPSSLLWKLAINANAKQLAWCSRYPAQGPGLEEAAAWTRQPINKPYAVVDIRSNLEEPWVGRYFELQERLLSGLRPSPIIVEPPGGTVMEQLLYSICLGEFVSLYTALLAGTDPVPAPVVNNMYKELL